MARVRCRRPAREPPPWPLTTRTVSHGGYTASVVLAFAAQHFASTLAHLDQPDTLTAHIEYLRRLAVGRVECAIDDTKLGGDASTVHVTLRQGTKVAIAAYVT